MNQSGWARRITSLLRGPGFAAFALASMFVSLEARSEESPIKVWLNPGFYSQHFDSGKNLRNSNPGLGVEVAFSPDHTVMAGAFTNSNGKRSEYATYWWRPLQWKLGSAGISAGVAASVLNGYPNYRNGNWYVAAMPALAIEGERVGVNLILIPTIKDRVQGAISIQVKLRVW